VQPDQSIRTANEILHPGFFCLFPPNGTGSSLRVGPAGARRGHFNDPGRGHELDRHLFAQADHHDQIHDGGFYQTGLHQQRIESRGSGAGENRQARTGKHEALLEGRLYNQEDTLCARSRATFVIFSPAVAKRLGIARKEHLEWFEEIYNF